MSSLFTKNGYPLKVVNDALEKATLRSHGAPKEKAKHIHDGRHRECTIDAHVSPTFNSN